LGTGGFCRDQYVLPSQGAIEPIAQVSRIDQLLKAGNLGIRMALVILDDDILCFTPID
jgi:hypothetical protein